MLHEKQNETCGIDFYYLSQVDLAEMPRFPSTRPQNFRPVQIPENCRPKNQLRFRTYGLHLEELENTAGKEEGNDGNQHFPLFPRCFQKPNIL